MSSVDEAMRRRLNLIPFTVKIRAADVEKDLSLVLQDEWSGILEWAIQGCVEYLGKGLQTPSRVQEATDDYFETQDTFAAWIAECCEKGPDKWENKLPLYRSWSRYAKESNERVGNQTQFTERMEAAGYHALESDRIRGRHWPGIAAKHEPVDPHWSDGA